MLIQASGNPMAGGILTTWIGGGGAGSVASGTGRDSAVFDSFGSFDRSMGGAPFSIGLDPLAQSM
jgi:hypothetical protein